MYYKSTADSRVLFVPNILSVKAHDLPGRYLIKFEMTDHNGMEWSFPSAEERDYELQVLSDLILVLRKN